MKKDLILISFLTIFDYIINQNIQIEMSERLNVKENEIQSIIHNMNQLSRGLSGLGDSFYQVNAAINSISSSSITMINSIKQISEGLESIKIARDIANASQGLSSVNSNISGAVQSAGALTASSQGASTGGTFNLLGGIMGGIGAIGGIAGGIIGIFTRRREEEKKYRREMEKALYAQLAAETSLSIATAERLANEKAITQEKYKQLEANRNTNQYLKSSIIDDIDRAIREAEEKLDGRYSSAYKRKEKDFLNALLKLRNNAGNLDWLETMGDSPLMAQSNEHMDEYMSYYNSLLEIARAQEKIKENQEDIINDTIGSTANDLAQLWIEAFEKGEAATWDFAHNFKEVMRQAVINGFAENVIMAQIQPIFDSFKKQISEYLAGRLELDELITPTLESQIKETSDKIKELSPQLGKILESLGLEVGNSSSGTLSASIKGVSEDTASAVAGQMNAIRSNQVKSLEYLTESITVLNKIEDNTRYCRHLQSIDHRLESVCNSLSINMSRF